MNLPEDLCAVCANPVDEYHQATCQMCGGRFHQPWSQDAEVPRCGCIASHHDALALVFLCSNCYQALQSNE